MHSRRRGGELKRSFGGVWFRVLCLIARTSYYLVMRIADQKCRIKPRNRKELQTMNSLSTKDLNRLRSQSKIIVNRVEIFIETYLSDTSLDENMVNEILEEIIKAANNLTTAVSKMKTAETAHHFNGSK